MWGSFLLGGVLQGRQLQLLAGFLFAGGLLIALIARAPAPEPSLSFLGDSGEVRAERAYGELPLSFERDAGRSGPQVDFIARTPVGTSYIGAEGATLALGDKQRTEALRFRLSGAASPEPRALERLPGEANYLVGDDPSRWRTEIPAFERIRYANVYPGVSIDWHGSQQQLEYDFRLAPHADPSQIAFQIEGANRIRTAPNGDLLIGAGGSTVRHKAPVAYQTAAGKREPIPASFVLHGDTVGFKLGAYDHSRPLVIDPLVLAYSTYLAGNDLDNAKAIAVDSTGAAYVVGLTNSSDYCMGAGCSIDTNENSIDAFISKLNPSGSALAYSTYLGGNGVDEGNGIAVDSSGAAYVTGMTGSTDFNTMNPLAGEGDPGDTDVFVSKLTPAGSALTYSTYLGGGAGETGRSIALDSSGTAYVTGDTNSTDFDTVSEIDTDSTGVDAFASKLTFNSGTNTLSLGYSTYLSGDAFDSGYGIAVDSGGAAYVTGWTMSSDYCTVCSFQTFTAGSSNNPFVTKLNSNGTLGYSTYLAGSDPDEGHGIAVDGSGSAYVTGYTASVDFPTVNPIEGDPVSTANDDDAFISKFNPAGTALVYSTYLGGSTDGNPDPTDGDDQGNGIALDSSGAAYVTGRTESIDFNTVDPIEGNSGAAGDFDVFVSKLTPAGSALTWSTYLGGTADDQGLGIGVDTAGAAYVTGFTGSTDYDTMGPIEGDPGDTAEDAFVSKVAISEPATPQPPATDTDPPETLITKAPKNRIEKPKAKYKFSSDEAGSSFECAFDKQVKKGQFEDCDSPEKYKRLDDGKHKFQVRAIDPAGNVDSTPAKDKFKRVG